MSKHHPRRTIRTLERFLFFDLLKDKQARPVLIYVAVVLIACSLAYHWLEGWNMLDSVYFVVISFTTIGYGDLAPTRPLTKLITIFLALNGVAVLLMLLDEIQRIRRQQLAQTVANIKEEDDNTETTATS